MSLGLKFATGVNKLYILNLININYRYNNSDFNKVFIQVRIIVTTNISTDDNALNKRYKDSTEGLSWNSNIIIRFDQSKNVLIMDLTHYNKNNN